MKIYEVKNEKIVSKNIVDTSASGHEKLVEFLKNNNIDILLGQLKYNENVNCEHHHVEGEHHCENHNRCMKKS